MRLRWRIIIHCQFGSDGEDEIPKTYAPDLGSRTVRVPEPPIGSTTNPSDSQSRITSLTSLRITLLKPLCHMILHYILMFSPHETEIPHSARRPPRHTVDVIVFLAKSHGFKHLCFSCQCHPSPFTSLRAIAFCSSSRACLRISCVLSRSLTRSSMKTPSRNSSPDTSRRTSHI